MIKRTSLWALRIGLVVLGVFVIGVGAALARLSAGPVALPALTRQIESELSASREGRPVRIDHVELSWSGEPRALQLKARGVRFFSADGEEVSTAREATVGLAALPMLIGRISLVRADFVGGVISVTRKPDGALHIAFGPPGSPADIIVPAAEDDAPLAQRVIKILDGLEQALRPVGRAGSLRSLGLHEMQLRILDEGGGGVWTAQNASIELERNRRQLNLAVAANLEGAEGVAPAALHVTTDTRFQSALIEFEATGTRPRALLSPAALGVFASLDAPMNAKIVIGLDRQSGVNRLEGDVALGRGGADMSGQRVVFEGGRLHGRYDLEKDELVVDQLTLAGNTTRIRGEAHLSNASALLRTAPNAPAAFDVSLPALTLDVPGVFEAPFDLQRVRAAGEIAPNTGVITFSRLEASRDEAQLVATGALRFVRAGPEDGLYPSIRLDGRIDGPLDARAVVALWPLNFIDGARSYLSDAMQAGVVRNVQIMLNIPGAEIAAHQLRDPSLEIGFDFEQGHVRFIETMSPLTGARGHGVLKGNRFDLTVADARIDGLAVTQGRVEMPQLNPKGAPVTISARAEGEARALVGLLMQEPIALGERMPLEPQTVGGRGSVRLTIIRPNLSDVPFEDLRFTVDGAFDAVSGTMRNNGLALANGALRVRGDQRAITISGPMRLGASDVDVAWTERLGGNVRASSRYTIAGQFDADDLERLGYPARAATRGRLGVRVTGEGAGFDVETAQVDLDLRNAAAFLPRNFWTKRVGQPGTARFTVTALDDGGYALGDIELRGPGMAADGALRLFEDGRVRDGEVSRLAIDGRADLAVAVRRGQDGALEFAARGPLIDAAPFLDVEDPNVAAAQARPTPATTRPPLPTRPMRIAIRADRMELRGGAVLQGATANLTLVDGALQTLETVGQTPGGKAFSLALGPRPSDPQGRIAFRTEDAGFAWRGFTGADNIIGGTAHAEGTWRMGPPSIAQFNLSLADFRVVRVPAMASLLGSVGSLTGFVEMLNGEGITFSSLDAPVTMNADHLAIGQSRMAGPSLGFTASGAYDMTQDNLDIDGVVVPSYGVNSILSNVPILGNLLASRRGEGVFGMTYAVNGPAAAPRVGVNPLSALTPGILRRIFEPLGPRRPSEPAATQQAAGG